MAVAVCVAGVPLWVRGWVTHAGAYCLPRGVPTALAGLLLRRAARTDPELIPEVVGRGCPGLPKSDGYGMWDPVVSPHEGVQGIFTVVKNGDVWRSVRRAYGPAIGPGSMG